MDNNGPFSMSYERNDFTPLSSSGALTRQYNNNPRLMVDDLKQLLVDEDDIAKTLTKDVQRFRIRLSEREVERQLERRLKLLSQFALAPFQPKSEEEFENWVDSAAIVITKNQVCVSIFQDAWSTVAPPSLARHIGSIPTPTSHELLVNTVASIIYKNPTYVRRFEVTLLQPKRQPTVFEARMHLEDQISRYSRLCERWRHPFHLSDIRCVEMALQTLPSQLEEDIRAHFDEPEWDQIWKRAASREERLQTHSTNLVLAASSNPIVEEDTTMTNAVSTLPPTKKKKPSSPCPACGGAHWRKDCPFKKARCFECNQVGHIRNSCRNLAVKDNSGRVETFVEPKESGVTVHQRKDRTQQDKMTTAEGTIASLREMAEKRSAKASKKRYDKRVSEGKSVRPRSQASVALQRLQPSEDESEAEDSEEDDSDIDDGLLALEKICLARPVEDDNTVVFVPAVVNGHQRPVVADTGASRNLINIEKAKELNIRVNPHGDARQFDGLGLRKGVQSLPVVVTIGDRSRKLVFYIIDKPGLPLLICRSDLAKFRILVDPLTSHLIDRTTLEVVAYGIDHPQPQPTPQPELDVITQKKIGATDEELYQDGKKIIFEKLEHLPEELQQQVWALFDEFKETWVRPRPGAVKHHKAHYEYDGPIVKQQQRYLAPDLEEEFKKQTLAMIKSGVLVPSKSPFASCPVFASKKDGGWRLCLDFREVNKGIKPDRHPIPLLWAIILKAAHHLIYCCLDINWGFWSLPLDDLSREITAILTPYGLMEFTVAPFGIRNSPPEFQRMMDAVFAFIDHLQKYIDDIILFTNTVDEMLSVLRQTLQRCKDEGLFLKISKLELFKSEVSLLGFLVGLAGIRPDPKKVQGIKDALFPRSKKQLRSFLGAISFLRKFIPNLATIIAPLTHLTRKNAVYRINQSHVNAFNTAKSMLSEHTLLNAPKGDGAFVIVTDASDVGAGAALLQWQSNELVVLEFASKTFSTAEIKWPAYEREAYAIRWAVGRFEDYVKAGKVIVVSDHLPLKALYKSTNPKVLRWSLFLQQFDIDIRHINGEHNVLADWLSRSTSTEDPFNDDASLTLPTFFVDDPNVYPSSDPHGAPFIPFIPSIEQLRIASSNLPAAEVKDTYSSPDGIRYHMRSNKVYLPPSLREAVLYWFHVTPNGLHLGINRTVRRLNKWFWWPALNRSVSVYINACLVCVRKHVPSRSVSLSGVLSRPLPFQLISLDFVGPREWPDKSTYYYLVVIDHASRFMVTVSRNEPPTAEWLLNVFRRTWISIFAAPTAVLHDRGSEFRSDLFRDYILNNLRAIIVNTSSYYPQGNSINESSHRSLDAMLSVAATQYKSSFANALHHATLIHNATPHVSTGHSPYFFLHGLEPVLPGLQPFQRSSDDPSDHLPRLASLRANALCRAHLQSDSKMTVAQSKSPIKVGDWIVYLLPSAKEKVKQDLLNKFSKLWSLPAKVLAVSDRQITVSTWSSNVKIDVPISKVRILQGEIPRSLLKLNLQQLEVANPPELSPPIFIDGQAASTWSSALDEAHSSSTPIEDSNRKRRRTNLSVKFKD